MDSNRFEMDENVLIDLDLMDSDIGKFGNDGLQNDCLPNPASGNFSSTIPQTEIEYFDSCDFSQLIPSKWDDLKSNIAYLDMVSTLKMRKSSCDEELMENYSDKCDKRTVKNSKVMKSKSKKKRRRTCDNSDNDKNVDESILYRWKECPESGYDENVKVFYIRKVHRNNCEHQKDNYFFKAKRNRIKSLVQQDFALLKIFLLRDKSFLSKSYKIEGMLNIETKDLILTNSDQTLSKSNPFNCKNRKFRLFDKDVIIKKIMSNFIKFIKLLVDNLLNNDQKEESKIVFNRISKSKFCTIEQCKIFLKQSIQDLTQSDNNKFANVSILKRATNLKLQTLFSTLFINSKYFNEYLINRIKSAYDKGYLTCFISYINKIVCK